ncbi:TRAP transporter large permease [Bacillus dakarensis]|uniref:TRAP transporter large permease n=1 Tax=Robertmurraya dakarensis TaxID=1926278 RepID=UPI0009824119|nr:TRAP transporter large permease subunit [Bacillus dakarensis]
MDITLVGIILFGSLVLFMALGIPVGFTMGGISLILGFIFWDGLPSIDGFVLGSYTKTTEAVLTALPLYIFMAAILMYSDLADDLYEVVYRWFGGLRGGLAAGTTFISAVFAAMVGVVSVSTATLGMVARPSMLKRGYDDKLTLGVIMAGGTLGILIPPSIVMIVFASEAEVSAGALFMGGVIPGILAAIFFMIYAYIVCLISPEKGPAIPKEERFTWKEKFVSLKSVIIPLAVIVVVLGSIYLGIATPTEAGAVGAAGSLVAAGVRKKLTLPNLKNMFLMTAELLGLIFWILIGAVAYARIVSVTGVGQAFAESITGIDLNRWWILILMIVFFLIIGMFIDTVAALLITAPFFIPALHAMQFDLVWFGIIFVIACCIGNLSPPFGVSLFIMKGVATDVSIKTIYSAVWPFVLLLLLAMVCVMVFPSLVTWLPDVMRN